MHPIPQLFCITIGILSICTYCYCQNETGSVSSSTLKEMTFVVQGKRHFLPYEDFKQHQLSNTLKKSFSINILTIEKFHLNLKYLIPLLNNSESISSISLDKVTFKNLPAKHDILNLPNLKKKAIHIVDREITGISQEQIFHLIAFGNPKEPLPQNFTIKISLGQNFDFEMIYGFACTIESSPIDLCAFFPFKKYSNFGSVISINYTGLENMKIVGHQTIPNLRQLRNESTINLENLECINFSKLPNQIKILKLRNITRLIISDNSYEVKISQLHFSDIFVNITEISQLLKSTKFLDLHYNKYTGGTNLEPLFNNINNLEILQIRDKFYNVFWHMNWFQKGNATLKDLKFGNLNLYLDNCSDVVSYPGVESLSLIDVKYDSCFLQEIPNMFPNLIDLALSSEYSYDLVTQFQSIPILRTINIWVVDNYIFDPKLREYVASLNVPTEFSKLQLSYYNNTWNYVQDETRAYISETFLKIRTIYVIYVIVVCVFGYIGNGISFIVFIRKQMRCSTSFLLSILAVYDTTILIGTSLSALYFHFKLTLNAQGDKMFLRSNNFYQFLWFEVYLDTPEVTSIIENQAQIIYPIVKTAYTGSVYMVVLLTVERYFAVCRPFKVKHLFSYRRVIFYVISITLFSLGLNFPRWLEARNIDTSEYVDLHLTGTSDFMFIKQYHLKRQIRDLSSWMNDDYRFWYHGMIWNSFMYLIPMGTLILLNFMILKQLRKSAKFERSSTTSCPSSTVSSSLTKMLITVNLLFFITNGISGIIVWYCIQIGIQDIGDAEVYSSIPITFNSAFNFIIYAGLGRKFRAELIRLSRCT